MFSPAKSHATGTAPFWSVPTGDLPQPFRPERAAGTQ